MPLTTQTHSRSGRSLNRRARRTRLVMVSIAVLICTALVGACGSRVEDRVVAAETNTGGSAGVSAPAAGDLAPDAGEIAPGTTTGQAPAVASGTAPQQSGATGAATNAPAAKPGANNNGGATSTTPQAGPAPCTSSGPPITIAQVGAFSGFLGQVFSGMKLGMQVWAKDVNARGGLGCHPVQLLQKDDQSNPSISSSAVYDAVQSRGAPVLVGSVVPIAIAGYRSAVDKLKVPTLGGDMVAPDWKIDPYLFPQGGDILSSFAAGIDAVGRLPGVKKLAVLYCVEATICAQMRDGIPGPNGSAARAGMTVVSTQSISLTQTDFTTECQNAKNAGAQAIFSGMDGASSQRLVRSCNAIGFKFPIATAAVAIPANVVLDPVVTANGMYVGTAVAPFTESDTPGLKEYQAAFAKWAPNAPLDGGTMLSWSAGKLAETVVGLMGPEARTKQLTTAMFMAALGKIKNETLGGLTPKPGLTYAEPGVKPMPPITCAFLVRFQGGKPSAPNGSKPTCIGTPAVNPAEVPSDLALSPYARLNGEHHVSLER